MKKFIFMLVGLLAFVSAASAQYKINKTIYNYRYYEYRVGDPYNPGLAGVASFLIPGLGQMISGEVGRGAGFLVGNIALTSVAYVGFYGGSGELFLIGFAGALILDIASIVDAVRVAKVNNMAFWDHYGSSYNLQIQPYITPGNLSMTGYTSAGLTMKFTF